MCSIGGPLVRAVGQVSDLPGARQVGDLPHRLRLPRYLLWSPTVRVNGKLGNGTLSAVMVYCQSPAGAFAISTVKVAFPFCSTLLPSGDTSVSRSSAPWLGKPSAK